MRHLKPWTQRSKVLPVLIGIAVASAGCEPRREVVYVDLSRVDSSERLPEVRTQPPSTAPTPFSSTSITFPPLPAASYRLSTDQQRIHEVQQIMAKSREHALSEIASQLRDVYRRDVAHVEHDELAALKPEEAAELTRAMDARSLAFLDYAEKRGPLAARLALLGGFPDSDPTSQLPPARKTRALRNRFEQARSLRDEIAKLDQAYDAQVLGLFKQAGSGTENARARILREVAGMRAEADRRADQEAAAEVAKEQAELTSLLAERGVVSFPAQAGRTVVVQGSTPLAGPPTVDVPGKAEMEKRQRQALESDLKIWAALKGYVVSSHRRAARDATADFMRWRHSDLGTH